MKQTDDNVLIWMTAEIFLYILQVTQGQGLRGYKVTSGSVSCSATCDGPASSCFTIQAVFFVHFFSSTEVTGNSIDWFSDSTAVPAIGIEVTAVSFAGVGVAAVLTGAGVVAVSVIRIEVTAVPVALPSDLEIFSSRLLNSVEQGLVGMDQPSALCSDLCLSSIARTTAYLF